MRPGVLAESNREKKRNKQNEMALPAERIMRNGRNIKECFVKGLSEAL